MGLIAEPSVLVPGRVAVLLAAALADLPARFVREGQRMPEDLAQVLEELDRAAGMAERLRANRQIVPASGQISAAGPGSGGGSELLDVAEVAARCHLDVSTVRRAARSGGLAARRIGQAYAFTVKDVDRWEATR